LHLFFLALPDYLKVQNGLQLHEKNPRAFKIASKIKGTGDRIIEIVGGRAVHPVTPTVGGFLKTPAREEIEKLILEIKSTYPLALEAFDLFAGFRYPHLKRSTEYFSLAKDGSVDIFGDTIVSSRGVETPVSEYQYVITEKVRSYSSAKFAQHDGHGLMVGAIARLNLMEDGDLNPRAQKAVQAAGVKKAFTNSYQNNLAQAIEILHFLELAEKELTNFLWGKSERPKVGYQIKAGTGIGAVEAPRGTLYHAYEFNDKGVVTNCDIITPTVQNLTNLEDDANEYLKQNKMVNIPRKERELEMLVRAYDPCITCSVH
jgi:coenzyme F420-reducing hydrogenase alpha subunit